MDNKYVAYRGLYCGHCYSRTHIVPTAKVLREQMRAQGFERFGPYMKDFEAFWRFMNTLIDAEGCPGCRQEGGSPFCAVRTCAREKKLEACPLCSDYPCDKLSWLDTSEAYPMLKSDNQLMREKGFAAWRDMQEERRENGYTYIEARKETNT